ncbi:MAG: MFS transporter [Bacilli bacterium]
MRGWVCLRSARWLRLVPILGRFPCLAGGQAVATSMVYPNSIALVRRHFPEQLGRVLGWIGMGTGIAIAIGPLLGGLLMDWAGWQAIFWLNIPLAGLAALGWAILWPRLPATPATMTARTPVRAGILAVFQVSSWFGPLTGLALMGLSFDISNVVLQQVMTESVPATETGRASGVYLLLRYLGTMISSVLVAESLSRSGGGSQLFLLLLFVGLASTAAAIGLHDHSAQEGHITQGKL